MTTEKPIDSNDNSFTASVNHPSLTDKIEYIPDDSLSNQPSLETYPTTYDNTIATENEDKTSNNISASSPKDTSLQVDSSGDISSNWSFPYDKFEMDLLQDTPLPNVLTDIAISSSPSEDMMGHDDHEDNSNNIGHHSNHQSQISESSNKNELFDDYPSITRNNINRSFNELFDLQQPTDTSIKEPLPENELSQIKHNEDIVDPETSNENDQQFKDFTREQFGVRLLLFKKNIFIYISISINMIDFINYYIYIYIFILQEMKKELWDIKQEFQRVQVENMERHLDDMEKKIDGIGKIFKTGMQEYLTSQEYQDFLASRQVIKEHESNTPDEDIENNNKTSSDSSKISSLISLNQQQIEEDLRKDEELLKLRNFTDKVDQIVWDTISHMAQTNIQNSYNNEHVCERHKAWCESVLQKQLEIRKKPIDERLDETLFQLNHWSNFIRLQQDLLQKK
ncbi:unnamed protein product [Cunninghamella blakesleeana]